MILQRFVAIALLCFWLGGFTFYSGVVIPTAVEVIGSHREVGFVTQRVTQWLNVAGVATMAALLWNIRRGWKVAESVERKWLAGTLALLVIATIALIILHAILDARLDPTAFQISPRRDFHAWHRAYLLISTAQWGTALVHVWFMLSTWQRADTAAHRVTRSSPD